MTKPWLENKVARRKSNGCGVGVWSGSQGGERGSLEGGGWTFTGRPASLIHFQKSNNLHTETRILETFPKNQNRESTRTESLIHFQKNQKPKLWILWVLNCHVVGRAPVKLWRLASIVCKQPHDSWGPIVSTVLVFWFFWKCIKDSVLVDSRFWVFCP